MKEYKEKLSGKYREKDENIDQKSITRDFNDLKRIQDFELNNLDKSDISYTNLKEPSNNLYENSFKCITGENNPNDKKEIVIHIHLDNKDNIDESINTKTLKKISEKYLNKEHNQFDDYKEEL